MRIRSVDYFTFKQLRVFFNHRRSRIPYAIIMIMMEKILLLKNLYFIKNVAPFDMEYTKPERF